MHFYRMRTIYSAEEHAENMQIIEQQNCTFNQLPPSPLPHLEHPLPPACRCFASCSENRFRTPSLPLKAPPSTALICSVMTLGSMLRVYMSLSVSSS